MPNSLYINFLVCPVSDNISVPVLHPDPDLLQLFLVLDHENGALGHVKDILARFLSVRWINT